MRQRIIDEVSGRCLTCGNSGVDSTLFEAEGEAQRGAPASSGIISGRRRRRRISHLLGAPKSARLPCLALRTPQFTSILLFVVPPHIMLLNQKFWLVSSYSKLVLGDLVSLKCCV